MKLLFTPAGGERRDNVGAFYAISSRNFTVG
jgi:hypothetical protein